MKTRVIIDVLSDSHKDWTVYDISAVQGYQMFQSEIDNLVYQQLDFMVVFLDN